ncbi:hypothetical protein JXM67_05575 [candidate division WOR-3 bacterium]|nr:hypothetical protein [candidate division WOR-3 bacterium]
MEERKKILELLEAGKINPEEARNLLEALKRSYSEDPCIEVDCHHVPPGFVNPRHHRHAYYRRPYKKVLVRLSGDDDWCR